MAEEDEGQAEQQGGWVRFALQAFGVIVAILILLFPCFFPSAVVIFNRIVSTVVEFVLTVFFNIKLSPVIAFWLSFALFMFFVYLGLVRAIFNRLTKTLLSHMFNVSGNQYPKEAEKALYAIIHIIVFAFLAQSVFFFINDIGACPMSGPAIPEDTIKNTFDSGMEATNSFLERDSVHAALRFVVIPIGIWYVLFTVFREIGLFSTWIDLLIALTMTLTMLATPLLETVASVVLGSAIQFAAFIILVLIIWKSWTFIRAYGHHQFENPWHNTQKFVHIVFFIATAIVYGFIGRIFFFMAFDWSPRIGGGFLIGAAFGVLIAFIVWFEHYKLPKIHKKELLRKKRQLRQQIWDTQKKLQDADQYTRRLYSQQLQKLQDDLNVVNARLDEVNDRINRMHK